MGNPKEIIVCSLIIWVLFSFVSVSSASEGPLQLELKDLKRHIDNAIQLTCVLKNKGDNEITILDPRCKHGVDQISYQVYGNNEVVYDLKKSKTRGLVFIFKELRLPAGKSLSFDCVLTRDGIHNERYGEAEVYGSLTEPGSNNWTFPISVRATFAFSEKNKDVIPNEGLWKGSVQSQLAYIQGRPAPVLGEGQTWLETSELLTKEAQSGSVKAAWRLLRYAPWNFHRSFKPEKEPFIEWKNSNEILELDVTASDLYSLLKLIYFREHHKHKNFLFWQKVHEKHPDFEDIENFRRAYRQDVKNFKEIAEKHIVLKSIYYQDFYWTGGDGKNIPDPKKYQETMIAFHQEEAEHASGELLFYVAKRLADLYQSAPFSTRDNHPMPDDEKVKEWLTISVHSGSPYTQHQLGRAYYWARGSDKEKQRHYYKLAADQGYMKAALDYGKLLLHSDKEDERIEASEYIRRAYAEKPGMAWYEMAFCYADGIGCDKDYRKVKEICEDKRVKKMPQALFLLGKIYLEHSAIKDVDKALDYFNKSADKRFHFAIYYLGMCYEKGIGVERDLKKSLEYYKKINSVVSPVLYKARDAIKRIEEMDEQ